MPSAKDTLRGEWWGVSEDASEWVEDPDSDRPLVVVVRKSTYVWLSEAAAKIRETEGAIFGDKHFVDVPNFGGAVLDGLVQKAVGGRIEGHPPDVKKKSYAGHRHSLQPDIDAVRAILDGKLIAFLEATPLEIGQAAAIRAMEYVYAVRRVAYVSPGWRPPKSRGKSEKYSFHDLAKLTYSDVSTAGIALWRAEQGGVVEHLATFAQEMGRLDRPFVTSRATLDAANAPLYRPSPCAVTESLRIAHMRRFDLEGVNAELARKPLTGVPLPPALALAFEDVEPFCRALGVTPGYHLARVLSDVLGDCGEALLEQAEQRVEPTAVAQNFARSGTYAASAAESDRHRAMEIARPDGVLPFDPSQFTTDSKQLPMPVRVGEDGVLRIPGHDPDWRSSLSRGYADKLRARAKRLRSKISAMLY